MTDTRPNGFSFTANTHGTNVEVAVSVHSLFDDAPSDAEVEFANELVVKLADAVAEYEPAEAVRNESLDAYVVLANTHQLLDLARDSVETTAPQARRYFSDAADNLEILKEWDPRFTTAYYQARKCEQAAGNFSWVSLRKRLKALRRGSRYASAGTARPRARWWWMTAKPQKASPKPARRTTRP